MDSLATMELTVIVQHRDESLLRKEYFSFLEEIANLTYKYPELDIIINSVFKGELGAVRERQH